MPKKKTQSKEDNGFDMQKLMQNSDSYKSLIYGIVTVVVLFIVIALGVRTLSQNQSEIDDQAAMTEDSDDVLTSEYVVAEGETLWSIAEKSYNDGYAWVEIAKANNLSEPYELEKGQKLVIPKITATSVPVEEVEESSDVMEPTATPMPSVAPSTKGGEVATDDAGSRISGESYTIVEGDNLWTISERAYGTGYKWVEIAKENKIANPDLIYAGDTLKLSRP